MTRDEYILKKAMIEGTLIALKTIHEGVLFSEAHGVPVDREIMDKIISEAREGVEDQVRELAAEPING